MAQSKQQTIIRTAESVSPKHPDKICDQISDAVLDAYLARDTLARVAVDVAGGHGTVFVTGEVTTKADHLTEAEIAEIVHRVAGSDKIKIVNALSEQSPEIAQGVDTGGAGDQGIMVGYACRETDEFIPLEAALARSLNEHLFKKWPYDGKTQVTIVNGEIQSIVASFQHAQTKELRNEVEAWLFTQKYAKFPFVSSETDGLQQHKVQLHINPSGDWDQGGFDADAGLTGRKLAVDCYGPRIPLGGGAFSGKDPSKVDRSAAYAARKIAVDYLKQRPNAAEVFVQLAYAIGEAEPLQATVTIDGEQEAITGYDLTPAGIIELLDLRRPIYEQTARFGHFGNVAFPWG